MEEPDFVPPPPSKAGHQDTTEAFTTVLHGKGCFIGFAIIKDSNLRAVPRVSMKSSQSVAPAVARGLEVVRTQRQSVSAEAFGEWSGASVDKFDKM